MATSEVFLQMGVSTGAQVVPSAPQCLQPCPGICYQVCVWGLSHLVNLILGWLGLGVLGLPVAMNEAVGTLLHLAVPRPVCGYTLGEPCPRMVMSGVVFACLY